MEALAVLVDQEAEKRHTEFAKSRAEAGRRRQGPHHYGDPAADPAVAGTVLGTSRRDRGAFQRMEQRIESKGFSRLTGAD
ncbi:hypothetical protein ACFY40_09280 [Streptomyces sp. NPDC012950]|uniref:hypothetical protein n=1 Tax=Streptomyces sp. NPDC012950 TaxID=3364858 RepID=UPI0036A54278